MQWIDWMSLAIALVVAIVQGIRGIKAGGMGLALFEAAGLVIAAVVSTRLAKPVAMALHVPTATLMLVMFVVLGVGAFLLGRWLYTITQWSLQSFDGILSFVFGVVAGWTIAYMVLNIIIEYQGGPTGAVGSMLANAPVAGEIYEFRGWHWLMRLLFRAKLGPEFDPDVN